jgi:hypothetical protein
MLKVNRVTECMRIEWRIDLFGRDVQTLQKHNVSRIMNTEKASEDSVVSCDH